MDRTVRSVCAEGCGGCMSDAVLDSSTWWAYFKDGAAPPLRETAEASATGRLWRVDTGTSGADSLCVADSAAEALADVYEGSGRADDGPPSSWHEGEDAWFALGWAERAEHLRWKAELAPPLVCGMEERYAGLNPSGGRACA